MKFNNIPLEEQETNILIDYARKYIEIYTSRYSAYNRLVKKLEEPTRIETINNKITGAFWRVPFTDKKRVKVILSMTIVIGQC